MDSALIILAVLYVAAKLYRHSIPQRVALCIGLKCGRPNFFLFDDFDEQQKYKFNQSVRIWHGQMLVSIAIGVVEWRHLPRIVYARIKLPLDKG